MTAHAHAKILLDEIVKEVDAQADRINAMEPGASRDDTAILATALILIQLELHGLRRNVGLGVELLARLVDLKEKP